MKTFARLFTFLISLEMILAPLGVNGIISVAEAQENSESCAKKGMVYNASQGRCNVKSEVTKTENQVDHCRSLTDENARKNCYQRNVDNGSADVGKDGYKDSFKDSVGGGINVSSAAAISLPLFFLMKQLKDGNKFKTCKPASLMLLYSGGGVLALGEITSYIQHQINLGKLKKAYNNWNVKEESESADDNKVKGMNSQSEAFELLAKNQDAIKSVATTKAVTYGVATGVFAAGAVMGAIEQFQLRAAQTKLATSPNDATSLATINRIRCGTDQAARKKTEELEEAKKAADKQAAGNAVQEAEAEKIKKETEKLASDANNKSKGLADLVKKVPVDQAKGLYGMLAKNNQNPKNPETIEVGGEKHPTGEEQSLYNEAKESCDNLNKTLNSTKSGSAHFYYNSQTQSMNCLRCNTGERFNDSTGSCDATAGLNLEDILNYKIKNQAIKNIAHANNFGEVIELLEELNSIDYENYSNLSYHDEETRSIMKEVNFEKSMANLISTSLLNSSYAQETTTPVVEEKKKGPSYFSFPDVCKVETDAEGNKTEKCNVAESKVGKILDKALYTPLGRASLNTLLGGWMGIMTGHMMKNVKLAKERAVYLRGIKSDFDTTGGITTCSSNDRDDVAKPICYCYNPDNTFNAARANSKVCANKYVGVNQYPNPADGAYDQKSCVTQNYEVDTACACKKNNSCVKVSQISGMGIDPGTFRMLGSMVAPANELTNGQASPASINSASIGNNAAKVKKKADELMSKIPEVKKTTGNLEKSLIASTSGLTPSSGFGSGGSNLSNFNPSQAAAELKKEIEENKEAEIRSVGIQNSGSGEAATESLEFGLTEDMLNSQESEIAEIMQKDLDMGSNDINNNDSTNIFEVLSNRYKRSGMRRLFDENNSAPAEKPAKSDISE